MFGPPQSKLVGGFNPFEKQYSQIGSSPQVGVKIKNIWNHQVEKHSHVSGGFFFPHSSLHPSLQLPTIGGNLQMARAAWLRTAERGDWTAEVRCCWRFFSVLLGLPEVGSQNQSHMDFWCKFGPQLLVHWWFGFLGSPFFVKKMLLWVYPCQTTGPQTQVSNTVDGRVSSDFIFLTNTVDGQNPAPVDRQFIPVFTWFLFIPGG